ncbi:class I SAM-dependent methyltransferase [Paenibacillus sp. y28]|uniref:class I SAM-dependent methyltransferase n=1 Tax=Paenibacillus sp. y28 TaxID=3129110 RepID=UPI00301B5B45
MPNHETIYAEHAAEYDLLISKQPKLGEVIASIRPWEGLDVVDLGAGTGRLSAMLAAKARSLVALDASPAMLEVLKSRVAQELSSGPNASGLKNWRTELSGHLRLPLPDSSADLIVSGWSLCYSCGAQVPDWENNLAQAMTELERALRPGGTVILFENMGSGSETPAPPDFLLPYFALLEERYGFSRRIIRTDYRFDSVEEAEVLTAFFFGRWLAERVRANNWSVVPECAGVWWRTRPV